MAIQMVNAMVCYHAAYYPSLYVTCIIVNNMVQGAILAGIPVATVNVFGLEHGPGILSLVDLGVLFASIFNVLQSVYLLNMLGFQSLFYIGALFQFLCLVVLHHYEEDLDVENLRKYDGIKIEQEAAVKSDDPQIEL